MNAISEAAATERAKTKATVRVSASSTSRPACVHNPKFLEDEVPSAHPGTSQPFQECELLSPQAMELRSGGWELVYPHCLLKKDEQPLSSSGTPQVVVSVQLGSRFPKS